MSPGRSRVPPPTRLPGVLTAPMSLLYRLGIGYRNRRFDAGKGVASLECPVISVGNLSTGGTGKTPMVHLIVGMLRQHGHRPVIAMRGYGARPGQKGDEQLEHEDALPGVPVVAQPDRLAGLRALLGSTEGHGIDCVVLDDGFQHRQIARDLDIVLVDASRPPDRDALLPRGHLREPMDSLSRAGLVVLTHAERVDAGEIDRIRGLIARNNDGVPVITGSHAWSGLKCFTRNEEGWNERSETLGSLRGVGVRVVCGIGNAEAFISMVRASGAELSGVITLRDHASIGESEFDRLLNMDKIEGTPPVLMTRKDWVKACRDTRWANGIRVIVPELAMDLGDEEPVLEQLISGLDSL